MLPILTVIVRSLDYDWHWRAMDTILFMASEEASYITGVTLPVAGGDLWTLTPASPRITMAILGGGRPQVECTR